MRHWRRPWPPPRRFHVDIKTASALHRLRLVSVPEALSFPALLIFGSLLSRISDIDYLLLPLGLLHAFLFMVYAVLLLDVWYKAKWPFKKVVLFFVLAVVPLGGLYGDKLLKREEADSVVAARAREAAQA
ncbi:membrane protein [Streptomyces sp. XY593]|nr:membrane protein [Streptomyces sp. WM6349]KOU85615.1 membrane protein [Streptomyces sp. XY593]KOU97012.1 membrane protein [Streptomyces sp. XY533]KOV16996.1 membrane protein [Streptomyces sp. XY511]KOV49756.1 membrane protein [Streptomyces sp. H036]